MNVALVLAAGSGTRMEINQPKQFVIVNGKPLFIYSVETFQNNPKIDAIVIVTQGPYVEQVKVLCAEYNLSKVKLVAIGGESRKDSVFNGLQAISKLVRSMRDIVLIHDSARPLVSERIINDNILLCERYGAVGTYIQAEDTIVKSQNGDKLEGILNRQEIYQAQTPQTFEFGIIREAHNLALVNGIPNVTDDCQLAMRFGNDVYFVEGEKTNFKVTTPQDLELFEAIVKNRLL